MNFAKRGFACIFRKPGKSIILLLLIFILGNIIAASISVRKAVENTELNLRAKMSTIATISIDKENYLDLFNQDPEFIPEQVSVEAIKKIGTLSQVKYFDYSTTLYLSSPSLKRYSENAENQNSEGSYNTFGFTGVSYPDILDIKERKIELISGRVFKENEIENLTYAALISKNVADANNLTVGSIIKIESNVYDTRNIDNPEIIVATRKYDFEVIGIFEPVKQIRTGDFSNYQSIDEEWENKIYVSNRVLSEVEAFTKGEFVKMYPELVEYYTDPYYTTLFVLNDPEDLGAFTKEAAVFMPDYYTMEGNGSFDQVAAPIKSIQGMASNVLIIAVVAAVVTISLLVTLFLRDRRREIGIYLSLGERKTKVAGQIFLEVILVAMVAITLSLFSGNILSSAFSEKMLSDQIIANQANSFDADYFSSELEYKGYGKGISSTDLVEAYNVSLEMVIVFMFYVIGLGTICVSTLIPMFYITRLNPKNILMGGEL